MFKGKRILVTGGTGMIGRELIDLLLMEHPRYIASTSLDNEKINNYKVVNLKVDLRDYDNCRELCGDADYVFHLAGIKGSPKMTEEKPASFLVPMLQMNTNILEAARIKNVKKLLYTSSIAVEHMEFDKYPAWAKKTGELQVEAYRKEYKQQGWTIVRPGNVYGKYDNFDKNNAMVIPSLIARIYENENPLNIWGDGNEIRDFIYAEDVARGMIMTMEHNPQYPINLGAGMGYSIKDIVGTMLKHTKYQPEIKYQPDMARGERTRVMNTATARMMGFRPQITLEEGLERTIMWYEKNTGYNKKRYNIFDGSG